MLSENVTQANDRTPLPLARTKDLVVKEMSDEVLVYDLKSHKAHCLNWTAALVWKHCLGQRTVADITRLIAQEQHVAVDEGAVWLALQRLSRADLLEEPVALPTGSPRFGRREAMRQMGLGTAIAVPIVMSIIAPTAEAACTVGAPGTVCPAPAGGVGSPGIVPTAVCCSTCCSDGSPSRCVTPGLVAPGGACNRGCQCASNTCINSPGTGGTCS